MHFEILIVLTLVVLSLIAFVLSLKNWERDDSEIPLDELAKILLIEYRDMKKLPVSSRINAKENWDARFIAFCGRLEAEKKVDKLYTVKLVKK